LKNKDKIVKNIEDSSCSPQRKKLKVSNFPQIEDAILKWIHRARDHNLPVSGPLIQEKQKSLLKNLDLNFTVVQVGYINLKCEMELFKK